MILGMNPTQENSVFFQPQGNQEIIFLLQFLSCQFKPKNLYLIFWALYIILLSRLICLFKWIKWQISWQNHWQDLQIYVYKYSLLINKICNKNTFMNVKISIFDIGRSLIPPYIKKGFILFKLYFMEKWLKKKCV